MDIETPAAPAAVTRSERRGRAAERLGGGHALVNLTGDPGKDYFGDGMAEEIINALGQVQGLKVSARISSFAYKGRNLDIRQIAQDLGVSTVLEGSVRSAGSRIRITAQLIDARSGYQVWSRSYDRDYGDIFKLQDDLAQAILKALQVNLNGAAPASVALAPPTQNIEAYDLYLQGESGMLVGDHGLARYQRALALDPKFARAYVGVGLAKSCWGSPQGRHRGSRRGDTVRESGIAVGSGSGERAQSARQRGFYPGTLARG